MKYNSKSRLINLRKENHDYFFPRLYWFRIIKFCLFLIISADSPLFLFFLTVPNAKSKVFSTIKYIYGQVNRHVLGLLNTKILLISFTHWLSVKAGSNWHQKHEFHFKESLPKLFKWLFEFFLSNRNKVCISRMCGR